MANLMERERIKSHQSVFNCFSCSQPTEFNCIWCPGLGLCSNGFDRNRQRWENELCYLTRHNVVELAECPVEMVQSTHEFYNQTAHFNPKGVVRPYRKFNSHN